MSIYSKDILSNSADGNGIKVNNFSGSSTSIHTGSTTATSYDEVWIYANSPTTGNILLTLMWGGTADSNLITTPISGNAGSVCVVPGFIVKGNASPKMIGAFVNTGSYAGAYVNVYGFVNKIV